jgi:hypothetical protein
MTSDVHGLAESILRNGYTTGSNLEIQCYSIKVPMTFFTEINRKNNSQIHKEAQKILYSPSDHEQKEQCCSYHNI